MFFPCEYIIQSIILSDASFTIVFSVQIRQIRYNHGDLCLFDLFYMASNAANSSSSSLLSLSDSSAELLLSESAKESLYVV